MSYLMPTSWPEALAMRAVHPEATVVAGGTDVLVGVNLGRAKLTSVLDISRVAQLRELTSSDGLVRIGAGVTYTTVVEKLSDVVPALAGAARSVGSPPIRNRGTVGGNLGTASPAGDCHPPLLATRAEVELVSTGGIRWVPVADFFTGPKQSVLAADELISALRVPVADGPQRFAKVGTRNAMVIAICSFALALRPSERRVGTGIGSAGPTPLRAAEAEDFLAAYLDAEDAWVSGAPIDDGVRRHFAHLVATAARPVDDVRGTATYRAHALAVLAGRLLDRCWEEYRTGTAHATGVVR